MFKKILTALLAGGLAFSCTQTGLVGGTAVVRANEKVETVVDVTDYGADPSGMKDSTQGVAAALEAAKEMQGPVTVSFPKGEYHFWKDYASVRNYHTSNTSSLSYPQKHIAVLLEDLDDVTLEGNDSSLIMHGDMMAIASVNSTNVTFKNFVLDYKDADTVDISVVGKGTDENGKQYTDFYVPANYNYKINQNGTGITWQ